MQGIVPIAVVAGLAMASAILGIFTEEHFLQYGALGVLALVILLAYKVTMHALDKVESINHGSQEWGRNREERLIGFCEEQRKQFERIVERCERVRSRRGG